MRVFLRFHDDDRETIGLFVTYNEDLPAYPGQTPAAESVTVARGLTRIKLGLAESGEGATPLPEAVHSIEAALRQRMVDMLVRALWNRCSLDLVLLAADRQSENAVALPIAAL